MSNSTYQSDPGYAEALRRIEAQCQDERKANELDLISLDLRTLPPEIGQLANLTTLHLYGNQLSTLPPEIGQLANLTTLHLSDHQLSTLPPEIGQLANLTTLFLYG